MGCVIYIWFQVGQGYIIIDLWISYLCVLIDKVGLVCVEGWVVYFGCLMVVVEGWLYDVDDCFYVVGLIICLVLYMVG